MIGEDKQDTPFLYQYGGGNSVIIAYFMVEVDKICLFYYEYKNQYQKY
jgi:hypothetical protein